MLTNKAVLAPITQPPTDPCLFKANTSIFTRKCQYPRHKLGYKKFRPAGINYNIKLVTPQGIEPWLLG